MRFLRFIFIASLLLLLVGGCSTATIIPPARAAQALPVHVADYGYHSSLILPRQSGGLIEYAYGDWNYFAHNNKSVGSAMEALLDSKQATLGRRVLARLPDQAGLKEAIGAVSIVRFDASKEKVEKLERDLEQRFSRRIESIMWSDPQQLYFVMDSERYSVTNNCNHLTARWLEELGCKVSGQNWIMGSHFKVNPWPIDRSDPTPENREAIVTGEK